MSNTLIGGGAIPTLIGFTGDMGSFGTGIALVGVITLGSLVALHFLKFHENVSSS